VKSEGYQGETHQRAGKKNARKPARGSTPAALRLGKPR
jgi:hypothetical protein